MSLISPVSPQFRATAASAPSLTQTVRLIAMGIFSKSAYLVEYVALTIFPERVPEEESVTKRIATATSGVLPIGKAADCEPIGQTLSLGPASEPRTLLFPTLPSSYSERTRPPLLPQLPPNEGPYIQDKGAYIQEWLTGLRQDEHPSPSIGMVDLVVDPPSLHSSVSVRTSAS